MSSYYYAWQAAQVAQEIGLRTILGGSLALSAAWISLPLLPARAQRIARPALSWSILVILLGTISLMAAAK